ncbi:MAG: hypothetical protein HIU81_13275 [Acidobacteria bacterium]|nr:hypothetical protein [Acidobacteriota bacterium]
MTRPYPSANPYGPRVEPDVSELADLVNMGRTRTQIANRFDVSTRTVSRWLLKYGINEPSPTNGRRITPEHLAEAIQLFDDGASQSEVARTVGISAETLGRHLPGRKWDQSTAGSMARAVRLANEQMRKRGTGHLGMERLDDAA